MIIGLVIFLITIGALSTYAFFFSPGKLIVTREYPDIYIEVADERFEFKTSSFSGTVTEEKTLAPGDYLLKAYDKYTNTLVFSTEVVIKSQKKTTIQILPNQESKDLLLEGD